MSTSEYLSVVALCFDAVGWASVVVSLELGVDRLHMVRPNSIISCLIKVQHCCTFLVLSRLPLCLSIARTTKSAAAGLLLWARRAGDIDRLLQQRHVVSNCGQYIDSFV